MELQKGAKVKLTIGGHVTIIKELGRGGQGIVYLVDLNGAYKALKWYINPPKESFYKNLVNNASKGAPSKVFLWPEYVSQKEHGSYGYVMELRPEGYYEFGQFLLGKKSFCSFDAMCKAAINIAHGFKMLHRYGLSYQDLNDGNFFINPTTGDVKIADNDNVMPTGHSSGILGKSRYMAPEIVAGGTPNTYSDRFSLSVILFMIFFCNHPLEGAAVSACPCLTEEYEKKFFGSEALFIYDKDNKSNPPVRGVHSNVIRRWPLFPNSLKKVFAKEFSQEVLKNPTMRLVEDQWENELLTFRDQIVLCPHCMKETFTESQTTQCINCGHQFNIGNYMELGHRKIYLTPGTIIYIDKDTTPEAKVFKDQNGIMLLQNLTNNNWIVETSNGKIKELPPSSYMPVKMGIKISLKVRNDEYKIAIK